MWETMVTGDIIVTRNDLEEENTTPGYWNHCALYVGEGWIVEALRDEGVIKRLARELLEETSQHIVMRYAANDNRFKKCMAKYGLYQVGLKYKLISSFRLRVWRARGRNCVTVIRYAFSKTMNYDPGWRKPDDIVQDPRFIMYKIG